eukprot:2264793-Prymnesium_polylepis.1
MAIPGRTRDTRPTRTQGRAARPSRGAARTPAVLVFVLPLPCILLVQLAICSADPEGALPVALARLPGSHVPRAVVRFQRPLAVILVVLPLAEVLPSTRERAVGKLLRVEDGLALAVLVSELLTLQATHQARRVGHHSLAPDHGAGGDGSESAFSAATAVW